MELLMPPRDPLSFTKGMVRLDSLTDLQRTIAKRPLVGLTQGGSSRKDAGAKPAATNGSAATQKTSKTYV